MLDERSFHVDIFGLHALYRRPIDAGDLEASLHRLAEALDLHVAALATRFTHCREFQIQDARQTLAPIRVTMTVRGAWHELLLYEQWDTMRGYGAETIDTLVRGLCRIVEPHLARSFRGSEPAFLSERECGGRLARLDWLQYFGPTLMEQLGIARVETGLFFRVEPTESGGCFVQTRPLPAGESSPDEGLSNEDRKWWREVRALASEHLGIPHAISEGTDLPTHMFAEQSDTRAIRIRQREDWSRFLATWSGVNGRESFLRSLTTSDVEDLTHLQKHGTDQEQRAAFALLHQLFIRHDPRLTWTLRHFWTSTLEEGQPPWISLPGEIGPSCDFDEWLYPSFGMTLPVDDGRWLYIAPGELPVTVRMSMATPEESDRVQLTLRIADDRGAIFERARIVGVHEFLDHMHRPVGHARRLRCSPA